MLWTVMQRPQRWSCGIARMLTLGAALFLALTQALVLRARDITRNLEPSFFVPGVLTYFKDDRVLVSATNVC